MTRKISGSIFLSGACLLLPLLAARPGLAQGGGVAAEYEGVWEIQPNGDVKVTRTYKLPMQLYQTWKKADVHMLEMRSLSSERASIEVADKKASWDDMNRMLVISMTGLGLAKNRGTHWEAKVPAPSDFSNLDDAKKTAYFHFSTEGSLGKVKGQDRIVLPAVCSKPTWNPASRTLTYGLPEGSWRGGAGGSAGGAVWWVLCAVCAVLGAGLWAGSFVVRR
jgi:hypothetical protein